MALPLFSVTLFVSAFILFLVQPMVGKMVLPSLGGTPQVWNTCMVFFQMVLLAGYAYTHLTGTWLKFKQQITVHCVVLVIPFTVLLLVGPFNFKDWHPPFGDNPILSTLAALTLRVGLPFFVVSATSPLLQKWFIHTGDPAAKDPYFLSMASNFGSFLALFAYPALLEPWLGLGPQAITWWVLYAVLAAMIATAAMMVFKSPPLPEETKSQLALESAGAPDPLPEMTPAPAAAPPPPPAPAPKPAVQTGITRKKLGKGKRHSPEPVSAPAHSISVAKPREDFSVRSDVITPFRRFRWVMLSAAPSSLMLGVVTYICTDLSPIPLLWVVPLALYLLTFILVFMRWPITWIDVPHKVMLFTQPVLVLGLCIMLVGGSFTSSPLMHIMLAMLAFFVTALVCHGELARDRPGPRKLTEFWLWLSVGGMVGGMFNGLVAPVLFWGVAEFPIAIVFGVLFRPQLKRDGWTEGALESFFPDLLPWFRDRGNDMARSYQRPEPNSPYLLNFSLDIILPLLLGGLQLLIIYLANDVFDWHERRIQLNPLFKFWKGMGLAPERAYWFMDKTRLIIETFLPMVLCFLFFCRPVRLGLGVAAILLVQLGYQEMNEGQIVYKDRSYFGVLRVRQTRDEIGMYHSLMHGTTHHGLNYQEPYKELQKDFPNYLQYKRLSTTYYHQFGPAGVVMLKYNWFKDGYRFPLQALKDIEDARTVLKDEKDLKKKAAANETIARAEADLKDVNKWRNAMLNFDSDARLPVSLIGLGGVDCLTSLVGAWSEPPYATIGLGTGTMASYGRPFQHVHYYEIDKQIRHLSLPLPGGTALFNYVENAKKRGAQIQIRMGDAQRMALPYIPGNEPGGYTDESEEDGTAKCGGPNNFYHMMVVDAFSSDAIPIHLITKESTEMYFTKLTREGILCYHTSNRHVDLVPVVEAICRSIKIKNDDGTFDQLVCLRGHDSAPFGANSDSPFLIGEFTSEWVMVARSREILDKLITPPLYEEATKQFRDPYWKIPAQQLAHPWTDDFSNVLSVYRWPPNAGLWAAVLIFVSALLMGMLFLVASMMEKSRR